MLNVLNKLQLKQHKKKYRNCFSFKLNGIIAKYLMYDLDWSKICNLLGRYLYRYSIHIFNIEVIS